MLPQLKPWAPHVTEDMRAKIRTIGIVVSEELPRVTLLEFPSKGSATGAGTVKVAIEAPSAETAESPEAQVRGVLQAEDVLHRLKHHVVKQLTAQTDISIATPPREVTDHIDHPETVPATGVVQPDAMLRIQLMSIDLRGPSEVDPPLAVNLKAQVTLMGPSVALPLYTHAFQYVTGARRLTQWTADDAKGFREAVDLSIARLAELMVEDLFLTYPFAHEHLTGKHGP